MSELTSNLIHFLKFIFFVSVEIKLSMDYTNILNNSLKDHLIVSNYNKDVLKGPELCVGIDEAGMCYAINVLY